MFQADGTYRERTDSGEFNAIDDSLVQEISSLLADLYNAFVNLQCLPDVERHKCEGDLTNYNFSG